MVKTEHNQQLSFKDFVKSLLIYFEVIIKRIKDPDNNSKSNSWAVIGKTAGGNLQLGG